MLARWSILSYLVFTCHDVLVHNSNHVTFFRYNLQDIVTIVKYRATFTVASHLPLSRLPTLASPVMVAVSSSLERAFIFFNSYQLVSSVPSVQTMQFECATMQFKTSNQLQFFSLSIIRLFWIRMNVAVHSVVHSQARPLLFCLPRHQTFYIIM